jgi:hypothetical protein
MHVSKSRSIAGKPRQDTSLSEYRTTAPRESNRNVGYNETMNEHSLVTPGEAEKKPSYTPGCRGRFIRSHQLADWWSASDCPGQAPALEVGDHWFIDPPMMWEARGETILTRTPHILPPLLWQRLN